VKELWEMDPDSAEYGKNSAASVIQSTFRRWVTARNQAVSAAAETGVGGASASVDRGEASYGSRPAKSSAVLALNKLQSMRHARGVATPSSKSGTPLGGQRSVSVPPTLTARQRDTHTERTASLAQALEKMGFSSESLYDAL
jgi:hypothetical protein